MESGLQEKLRTYEAGLQQVLEACADDPDNVDLAMARDQLVDVIKLTRDLLLVEQTAAIKASMASSTTTTTTTTTSEATTATTTGDDEEEADDEVEAAYAQLVLVPGALCEAQSKKDQKWSKAIVREVTKDGSFVVEFQLTCNLEALPSTHVRRIDRGTKPAGFIAEGNGAHKKGFKKERARMSSEVNNSSTTSSAAGGLQLREIPKYLKPHPADSPQDRKAKKRKIHAIKSQNRLVKLEAEGLSKQTQWKSFLTKQATSSSSNKNKKGGVGVPTIAKKESIFRSPDTPEGKVGVVGSGKPLTAPVGVREKWKFEKPTSTSTARTLAEMSGITTSIKTTNGANDDDDDVFS